MLVEFPASSHISCERQGSGWGGVGPWNLVVLSSPKMQVNKAILKTSLSEYNSQHHSYSEFLNQSGTDLMRKQKWWQILSFPSTFSEITTLLIWPWTSGLQNWETIHFCCVSHSVCDLLSQQPPPNAATKERGCNSSSSATSQEKLSLRGTEPSWC